MENPITPSPGGVPLVETQRQIVDSQNRIISTLVSMTPSPAELSMQNLAIHQTLMNEASAMTAKQQIMRNYMNLTDNQVTSRER